MVSFASFVAYDAAYPTEPLGPNLGWYIAQGASDWELVMYNGQLTGTALDLTGGVSDTTGSTTYYVAAVYDGTNASLYVDGVQVASGTPVGYVPNNISQFSIAGAGNGGNLWNGNAQDIALYTNALSAASILAHYQNGTNSARSTSYPALVLSANPFFYYRLNDAVYTAPDPTTYPQAFNLATNDAGVTNGVYDPGTMPGVAGPPYAGMGANSGACAFNGIIGAVNLQLLNGTNGAMNAGGVSFAGPLTLMAWFKVNDFDVNDSFGGMIIAQSDFYSRLGRNRLTNSIDWDANGTSPQTILGLHNMADGQWHHLVCDV